MIQLAEMQTEATEKQNLREWLSLSASKNPSDHESQSRPYPRKLFPCCFCRRKFYSTQALGGHQNAHRRERGFVRFFHSHPPVTQPLSNIHKPTTTGSVARSGFEVADFLWSGSFRLDNHDQQESSSLENPDMLDLTLKL